MNVATRTLACTCVVLACAFLGTAPVAAADKMSDTMSPAMPKVDCTSPDGAMKSSMMSGHPAMTGDVDHDFAAMMVAHSRMGMALANIEVQCGKNPKLKAAAQKTLEAAHDDMLQYDPTLHTS